jgi:hypothetical protein
MTTTNAQTELDMSTQQPQPFTVSNDGELAIQIRFVLERDRFEIDHVERVHRIDGSIVEQGTRSEFLRDLPVNRRLLAAAQKEGWLSDLETAISEAVRYELQFAWGDVAPRFFRMAAVYSAIPMRNRADLSLAELWWRIPAPPQTITQDSSFLAGSWDRCRSGPVTRSCNWEFIRALGKEGTEPCTLS